MEYVVIDRNLIPQFSKLSNSLANQTELDFALNLSFSFQNIEKQLKTKSVSYPNNYRSKLVENLKKQYQSLNLLSERIQVLTLLEQESTFVVTTGHQLNIATGPVYFLIKIIQTIKLANELNDKFPGHSIIPVFWMATEDHDLEEIQSVSLFGKTLKWETAQTGAVGRMSTEGLNEVKIELLEMFKTSTELPIIEELLNAFSESNLANATFKLVHQLFKSTNLLIINADQPELKLLFSDTMLTDISQNFAKTAVQRQNEVLEQNGIKTQAFVRDINLFYLSKTGREKLILSEKGVQIENIGDFSIEELNQMVQSEPQNFSPNVILRPLYQETILPNLVYIGGGGELAYWLQLLGVFDAAGIPYPMLLQRNSIVFTNSTISKKLLKLNVNLVDLFQDWESLSKMWITKQDSEIIEETVSKAFMDFSQQLENTLVLSDPTRKNLAEVEAVKLEKQRTALLQRLNKEKKQKFEIELKQLEELQEKINPNGGLMERSSNFLNFLGQGTIQMLIDSIYEVISSENHDLKVIQS